MNAITKRTKPSPAVQNAVNLWADATTRTTSERRHDLLRDKTRAVVSFFEFTGKQPAEVTEIDVKTWQASLEAESLSQSTIYGRVSRLSSFYDWMLKDPDLSKAIHRNPIRLARPKAPKAYQSESTQSLSDEEAIALVTIVKAKADRGEIVGKRDYALLLFYLSTGMRRAEVIRLRWGDLKINGTIVLTGIVKGGDYVAREIEDPTVKEALIDYLQASGRLATMQAEDPIWTRHDRAGSPGDQLTGHAFAANLKRYAKQAGIGDIHLHQTRHTFARMVAEETGSIIETQDALGHRNPATTKAYVNRIGVKRDKFSSKITARLGL